MVHGVPFPPGWMLAALKASSGSRAWLLALKCENLSPQHSHVGAWPPTQGYGLGQTEVLESRGWA